MRNVKKWIATVLTLAMVLAVSLTTTAFGAVNDTGYTDVDANDWYAEAVVYCRENGLMNGVGNGRFDPDGTLDREMLATVLWRLEGEPVVNYLMQFSDVSDSWYTEAVRWAASERIMGGYGGGKWGVGDHVTRQDMTTTLWRYAGELPAEHTSHYEDESAIANYAAPAVDWSDANGIVAPVSDTTFAPRENATRAQVAAALMNFHKSVQTAPDTTPNGGARVLVAYFSATNTTKPLAEYIADGLNADIYEIVPQTPYTSTDLNWHDSSTRATVEMNDPSARPAISGSVSSMEQYDVVFIGYPIWWGQAPRIISTFLESYSFSGKTIVPFCTSGSSGMGSSATNLHSLANGATWLSGQRFSGGTSRSAMIEWVNGLGLDITAH